VLRLTVSKSRCTGCRFCESVCTFSHHLKTQLENARIRIRQGVVEDPSHTLNVCRQCATCPPLDACPTSALTRDPETGILHLDGVLCPAGCDLCVEACPLGAIHHAMDGLTLCDLCGGDPECVKVCYTEALFVSEYRLTERGLGKRAAAAR